MTDSYSSNISRLKTNSRDIYSQKFSNANTRVNEINRQTQESIDNIKNATKLLIGSDPQGQWSDSFKSKKATFRGGEGLLPGLAGERAGKQFQKGDEARKKDNEERVARLAELAAHVDGLSQQDKEYHKQKINMLKNGAYYEDADRFTKLSPWAQVGYASHGIGLYNNSVADKLNNWLATSDKEINVGGTVFKPRSVHSQHDFPLILKEHAVNIGLKEIREKHGIDGYSEAMLDLFGVNDNPAMGQEGIGSETAAKNAIMGKYRKLHNIDASHKTRMKELYAWEKTPTKDLSKLITVFSGTLGFDGEILGNTGAWNMAENLVAQSLINGNLKGVDAKAFLDELGKQPSPLPGAEGKTLADTHQHRLDSIWSKVEEGKAALNQLKIKSDENKRDQLQVNFLNYQQKMRKQYGPEWKPNKKILELYTRKFNELGGVGTPTWITNAYTISTQNDRERISVLSDTLANGGTITEADWAKESPYVRSYFRDPVQTKDGGSTTRLAQYTSDGYLKSVLKPGGYYSDALNTLNAQVSGNSGTLTGGYVWKLDEQKARRRMEADFAKQYNFYKNTRQVASNEEAAELAFKDVQLWSAADIGDKESKYKGTPEFAAQSARTGQGWTGNPRKDSKYYNWPERSREEIMKDGELVIESLDWYNNNVFPNGNPEEILNTQRGRIPGTGGHLEEAIKFFKGERSTIPSFYTQLAGLIPGVNDYQLMKWQVTAHYPDIKDPTQLNPVNVPHPSEVLDMGHYNDVARMLGFKSTTCSKLQAKACLEDKRIDGDINPANAEEGLPPSREVPDSVTESGGPTGVAPQVQTIEDQPPQHHEITLPEGYTQTKRGNVISNTGESFVAENPDFWPFDARVNDTRTIRGKTETYLNTPDGPKWMGESDIVEHRLNTGTTLEGERLPEYGWLNSMGIKVSNIEARTKNVSPDILNLYGEGLEGRAKYLAAKLRYEKESKAFNNIKEGGIPPMAFGLGVGTLSSSGLGVGSVIVDERPIPGKNFNELDANDHKELDLKWFFASEQEDFIRQFPEEIRNRIRQMERSGQWNPETHTIRLEGMNGSIFGIPWELPNVKQPVLVPLRKESNLQSVMNSPDSPYLANNLREYAANLYVSNVLTEMPVNV